MNLVVFLVNYGRVGIDVSSLQWANTGFLNVAETMLIIALAGVSILLYELSSCGYLSVFMFLC